MAHETCPLHGEPLASKRVRVSYGLPDPAFMQAMQERFPHAGVVLGGCLVGLGGDEEEARVCDACEAAHRAWSPEERGGR